MALKEKDNELTTVKGKLAEKESELKSIQDNMRLQISLAKAEVRAGAYVALFSPNFGHTLGPGGAGCSLSCHVCHSG